MNKDDFYERLSDMGSEYILQELEIEPMELIREFEDRIWMARKQGAFQEVED